MWNILAALTLGLLMGFLIQDYVSSEPQDMVQNLVPVVVAGVNLSPGRILRPEVLQVVKWPREVLPPQTAETVKQVTGRLVLSPITRGEPILLPKLAPLNDQNKNLNIKKLVPMALDLLNFPSTMINQWLGLAADLRKVVDICAPQDNPVDYPCFTTGENSPKLPHPPDAPPPGRPRPDTSTRPPRYRGKLTEIASSRK
jgi:hypothetical protein